MLVSDKTFIGIDVSKATLDISISGNHFCIKNTGDSIVSFLREKIISKKISPKLVCLESTGGYEVEAIRSCQALNIPVHRAHPNRVHSFAKASGHFAKTDKLDARLLEKYAAFISCEQEGDIPMREISLELRELRSFERDLMEELHAWQCREKKSSGKVNKYHSAQIKFVLKQLEKVRSDMNKIIELDQKFKNLQNILMSFAGVGKQISSTLISDLPELGNLTSKKISSLVGVAPKTYESGFTKKAGKICGGRFHIRKALYMAALVASRHNKRMKLFYDRLTAAGKAKKVILVAIMRKIIVCLNTMVRKGTMYEEFLV